MRTRLTWVNCFFIAGGVLWQMQFILFLYFRDPRTAGSYTPSSRLKSTPSIPTDAHVSHSRTVSGSVVDGHSTHGAGS
ncbi:hypothetical protein A4E84_00475 [Streptomyces qaidamensis]|uniref:Uncharacterized protein n=1 Tax=Streptomyces qaidamensis TaxID=1783515 RepID=A0A143BTD9_9ACTN|nr:hypothetical protein A4E84_00475 [Streptomyces qaidamensis]